MKYKNTYRKICYDQHFKCIGSVISDNIYYINSINTHYHKLFSYDDKGKRTLISKYI